MTGFIGLLVFLGGMGLMWALDHRIIPYFKPEYYKKRKKLEEEIERLKQILKDKL